MDFTHRPNLLNAEFLRTLGGECVFTIVGAEEYTTRDDKVLKCLKLAYRDRTSSSFEILFNPNAGHKKKLNAAGLYTSEEMNDRRLLLYLQKIMMAGEEIDAVRIKDILPPDVQQDTLKVKKKEEYIL